MRNVKLAIALLEVGVEEAEEAADKMGSQKSGRQGVAWQDLALGLGGRTKDKQREREIARAHCGSASRRGRVPGGTVL